MRLLLAALVLLASPAAPAQPAVEGPLGRVLSAVVRADGRMDYRALARSHRADLTTALDAVAAQDPAALRSDAQKTAFLVNAYNARVLDRVLAHPRATHLERQGLFGAFFEAPFPVAGARITPDQIEHGLLRRQSGGKGAGTPRALRRLRPSRLDPRIHVALNCAAVSCPRLQPRAFSARTLDAALDRAMREWVASPRFARVSGGRATLSSLLDWFGPDFDARGPAGDWLLGYASGARRSELRPFLAGKTAAQIEADRRTRFAYDWTVNRAR